MGQRNDDSYKCDSKAKWFRLYISKFAHSSGWLPNWIAGTPGRSL